MGDNQVFITTNKAKTIALTTAQLDGLRAAFVNGVEKLKATVKTATEVGTQVGANIVNGKPIDAGIDNIINGNVSGKHLASNIEGAQSFSAGQDFDVEKNVVSDEPIVNAPINEAGAQFGVPSAAAGNGAGQVDASNIPANEVGTQFDPLSTPENVANAQFNVPNIPESEPTNAEIIVNDIKNDDVVLDSSIPFESSSFTSAEEDLTLSEMLDRHFEYENALDNKDFELETIRKKISKVMSDIQLQEICLEFSEEDKRAAIVEDLKVLNARLTEFRNEFMIVSAISQEMSDRYLDNSRRINEFVNDNSLSVLEFLATTGDNSKKAQEEAKPLMEDNISSVYVAYPGVGTKTMQIIIVYQMVDK